MCRVIELSVLNLWFRRRGRASGGAGTEAPNTDKQIPMAPRVSSHSAMEDDMYPPYPPLLSAIHPSIHPHTRCRMMDLRSKWGRLQQSYRLSFGLIDYGVRYFWAPRGGGG